MGAVPLIVRDVYAWVNNRYYQEECLMQRDSQIKKYFSGFPVWAIVVLLILGVLMLLGGFTSSPSLIWD